MSWQFGAGGNQQADDNYNPCCMLAPVFAVALAGTTSGLEGSRIESLACLNFIKKSGSSHSLQGFPQSSVANNMALVKDFPNGDLELETGREASTAEGSLTQNHSIVPDALQALDWDGPDDPENPTNWPIWKKIVVG
ncbi:hypothetical protein FZEAL_319 [Fusarium zealandicum]|uniref:Uncharacterized protein n=1 Tax=Fusarium zealandicum TaxID=1053134 RepID=A0A8H4UUW3_9HYPO|nr:hypothetical protein FZEAL_319 [Fusarium zealandicum]